MFYRLGFCLGDLVGVGTAEPFACGVDLFSYVVGFFECLVKDAADDTQAEVPARVMVVEHVDTVQFWFV